MDIENLINSVRFCLRLRHSEYRLVMQLPGEVEAALWEQAQRAANRLERLHTLTAQQQEPAPGKRRSTNSQTRSE